VCPDALKSWRSGGATAFAPPCDHVPPSLAMCSPAALVEWPHNAYSGISTPSLRSASMIASRAVLPTHRTAKPFFPFAGRIPTRLLTIALEHYMDIPLARLAFGEVEDEQPRSLPSDALLSRDRCIASISDSRGQWSRFLSFTRPAPGR
jgi:hypothetical protein